MVTTNYKQLKQKIFSDGKAEDKVDIYPVIGFDEGAFTGSQKVILPVEHGGTGSNDVTVARANLGIPDQLNNLEKKLIGTADDSKELDTINGAKNYVDAVKAEILGSENLADSLDSIYELVGAIGKNADLINSKVNKTDIYTYDENGNAIGGGKLGDEATTETGGAVGKKAYSNQGFAGGENAKVGIYYPEGTTVLTQSYGGAVGAESRALNGGAAGHKASTGSGGAIGQESWSSTGFAGGYQAKSYETGGAIGESSTTWSGGAAGEGATSNTGFAGGLSAYVGSWAKDSDGELHKDVTNGSGGAIGENAEAVAGFAGGKNAKALGQESVAIGVSAQASGDHSIAIGQSAIAQSSGCSLGMGSEALDTGSVAIGAWAKVAKNVEYAVQLGYGTNENGDTLQFRNYQLVNAEGRIPSARLYEVVSTLPESATDGTIVFLRQQTT